jgi:aryl-alcohol dehydrogenase-like predicted oxidoreductase
VQYVQLGSTGTRVSEICLGAMNFGGATDEAESSATIASALDRGINFIDTADVYNGGESERIVGDSIQHRRDDIVLATKVHGRVGTGVNEWGSSRRRIRIQCERSLKRLRTDRIDLYQLHRPDAATPIDETLSALDDLVHAGKVVYVGVSSFAAWQTVTAIERAERSGLAARPVSDQPQYNLLDRRIETEVIPMASSYGLAILPWSPLATGLLSGKYTDGSIPPDSRLDRFGIRADDPRGAPVREALAQLDDIAHDAGTTLVGLAMGWLRAQPAVAAPIIGPRDRVQLDAYMDSLDVRLDDATLRAIDDIVPPGSAVLP